MMNEYLTQSFMGVNEKFNADMVFETQLDHVSIKMEEEKYQAIFKERYNAIASMPANSAPQSLPSQSDGIIPEDVEMAQVE
jgi:hypothetical protein